MEDGDGSMGMYDYVKEEWKQPDESEAQKQRLIEWRQQDAIERVDNPTRIDKARELGYKAKQGFAIARARVPRGARKRPTPAGGRKPKRAGRFFTRKKSHQWIAEGRASRKFPNMEVLNSYPVGADGKHKWFEVILIDPEHPAIQNDEDVNWITDESNRNRPERGLTSVGKRSRGLRARGTGGEKRGER